MKSLWLGVAGFVVCVVAVWCSRTTYGEPPKALQGAKMISIDDAILNPNEILFADETPTEIRVVFRGLPSQGNGAYSVLFLRKTAENWRALAAATGVTIPPRATQDR
jgi:hypothetical protein